MKKECLLFIILILFSVLSFADSINKEQLAVVINETKPSIKFAESIKKLAFYSYNTKIFIKTDNSYKVYGRNDIIKEIKISDYTAIIMLENNSELEFTIDYYLLSKKYNYGKVLFEEEKFNDEAGRILEKLSIRRWSYSGNWKVLQLTYMPEASDEYPFLKNGSLYFTSDRTEKNRNIIQWNSRNAEQSVFSFPESAEYFPSINNSGSYLVFQGTYSGIWDIYLYHTQRKTFRNISGTGRFAYSPYFVNDNTILFTITETTKSTEIWSYDISKNQKAKLTDDATLMKFRPSMMNGKIIYQGFDFGTGNSRVYYLEKDEKTNKYLSKLLFDNGSNVMDCWSDGSTYIIYSQYKNGLFNIFLYDTKNGVGEDFKNELAVNLTEKIDDDCYYPIFDLKNRTAYFSVYYYNGEPDIWAVKF